MQQARVLPVTKQLQYLDCVWMIEIVLHKNSGPIFQLLSWQLNLINFFLKSFVTNNHKDKFLKENEKYSQEACEKALVLAFRRARFESFDPEFGELAVWALYMSPLKKHREIKWPTQGVGCQCMFVCIQEVFFFFLQGICFLWNLTVE